MVTKNSSVGAIAAGVQSYASGGDLTALTYTAPTAWTPNIIIGNSSTGITYAGQTGFYSQIGNIVYFNLNIALSSKGASSGDVAISNLPVTPGPNAAQNRICMQFDSVTPPGTYTDMAMLLNNNSPIVILFWYGADNAVLNVANTTIGNGSIFYATGFYFTN